MMNMNNEEFDRKMAFIVEQQAQFATDIQLLQESQAQLQESQSRTDQSVAHTAEVVGRLAERVGDMGHVLTRLANVTHVGFSEVNAKINALVDAQIRTEENMARTEANIARTEANLARTDENLAITDANLKRFIAAVDRRLSKGRNGK